MSKRFTFVTLVLSTSVAFLVGIIIAGGMSRTPVLSSASSSAREANGRAREKARAASLTSAPALVNFADVAERINPAVVNIDAASKGQNGREGQRLFPRTPEDQPDGRDSDAPHQGSGSGFIVDRGGYILTNNHVVEGAERITVTLADGRTFRGEVAGADPAIDVALVRIPGAANLPEAPLGNSDDLRPGEWVCAIGNPLGYVHSVTVGVVSFIGRKLFDQSLDDYIQTDAAINFGNSGGPLINTRGEVVGINSAISSRATSIGFAVPINQAVAILPQLKAKGRVSRGFIGVTLTDVTPGLQRALNLSVGDGAMVQDVTPRSPAERAGLRPYDVIVQVEGRRVLTNQELIRDISARQPGTMTRLEVVREGRRQTMNVKLAERPARGEEFEAAPGAIAPARPSARTAGAQPAIGVTVRELDRAFVGRLEIPDGVQGVIVSRVDPTGAAHQVLRRGFVIMEVNRKPTPTVADYHRIVGAAQPGDVLAIYYYDPPLGQRSLVTVIVD
jgi:serine protease Do